MASRPLKIYISSTFSDLKEHRAQVYHTLRQLGHNVIAMEDYVAADQRPLSKCLADVADCDLYVGIFAWRYGYIPDTDNPEQQSITELEYRKAGEAGKPRLIFLARLDGWNPPLMDVVTGEGEQGLHIKRFRSELEKVHLNSFFTTTDELARLASVAVAKALEGIREAHRHDAGGQQSTPPSAGSPRIFISYARSDGEGFAKHLRRRLIDEHGFALWQDRADMEGGKDWWQQIVEALQHVKYLVLVITSAALRSETVRKEWRAARQQGVCVVPVLATSNLDLMSLPRWMRDVHFVSPEIPEQWTRFIRTLESPCTTPRVPFMVEDLPSDFVPRTREFTQLLTQLLYEGRSEPIAVTTALRGAGGYGKTTLAKALCHDERIQEAFHDGILWVTLGEKPGDLTKRVEDLIYVLSGQRPGFASLEAASARLSEVLGSRTMLLVLDDVWNQVHLTPFLQGGVKCARLITTRNRTVLPPKTKSVEVDAMDRNDAVSLLSAGLPSGAAQELHALAARVGEWPLLLKLVNGTLRDRIDHLGQMLPAALTYVIKALEKRGLTIFDARDAIARDQAVSKTLGVSLELLKRCEQDRLRELAIFPEDVDIPLDTLEKLWGATGGLDDLDTEQLCERLHQLSLLLRFDPTIRRIRLHDVVRKYLEGEMHDHLSALHNRLLNAYSVETWVDLPRQEPYLWQHLSYHLQQAGRIDELRRLLLDFGWLQAKLAATNVVDLITDFDLLREDVNLRFVQGALRLAGRILAQDKPQLAGQLLGRLLVHPAPTIQRLLTQASQRQVGPWLRPLHTSLTPPGGPLLSTLRGHTSLVRAIAITPDGQLVISASQDATLKVWDLQSGQALHALQGHGGPVRAVVVTPDGQLVISASQDTTLKVWEVHSGQELRTFPGHTAPVTSIVVTPDGQHVISASTDTTLKVWEVHTGRELHTLHGHTGLIMAVGITPDGQRVISVADNGVLKVWALASGQELHAQQDHTSLIMAVGITPDGRYVILAADNGILNVWDVQSDQKLQTLRGHIGSVQAVAVTPDGRQVISASTDTTLKVWEVHTGRELHTLRGHTGSVRAVAVTPDGRRVISASTDTTLKVWEVHTGKEMHTWRGHTGTVRAVAVTPNGQWVISAADDGTLKVWDIHSGQESRTPQGHTGAVRAVAVTPNGQWVISAADDGTLKVWEVHSGQELRTFPGHTAPVTSIVVTPDGQHVISASTDTTLKVWEVHTGRELHTLHGHTGLIMAVGITPDGQHVISASQDTTLKVWEVHTGRELHTLHGHTGLIMAVGITPDGQHVISASQDTTLKVWEVHTGRELHTLHGHTGLIMAVRITPDGQHVISASQDTTLKVWEVHTGRELYTLRGHTGWVRAVAVTLDGQQVISASSDGTLKVWDLESGHERHTLCGHTGGVRAVAVTLDGQQVISASSDGTLKVWDLESGQVVASFSGDNSLLNCHSVPESNIIVTGEQSGSVHILCLESAS